MARRASRAAIASVPKAGVAPFPRERFLQFCSNLTIISKDMGLTQFKLLGTQLYVLDEICAALEEGVSTIVILKARQLGMSTFFIALDLFWAFEHRGLCGAFATHTDASRDQFRNIIKTFFLNLPAAYKLPRESENRTMLVLKGGSTFAYLVAGIRDKATGSLGRSGAYNFLHATEVAFWGSWEDVKELRATLSQHYPHRLAIYETTANGFNDFADMWEDAKEMPTQRAIFVGWWRNELYAYPEDHPVYQTYMANPKLSKYEKRKCAEVRELYGFEISPAQLAWYRWKLAEGVSHDQGTMDSQYPWTEGDAFVASGSKYFSSLVLTDAMRRSRAIQYMPMRYDFGTDWKDTQVIAGTARNHELKIFEEPTADGLYVLGCDPAFGSSDDADSSVIEVFRCYADKCVQVAEFATNSISPTEVAWALAHLGGYYKDVIVILEISGPGQAVKDELLRLKAKVQMERGELAGALAKMRYFLYRRPDAVLGGGMSWDWKMNRDRKWQIMGGLKGCFELQRVVVNSWPLLEEMRAISIKDGLIEGSGRHKDDRVVAAAMAVHAWQCKRQGSLIAQGMTYEQSLKPPKSPPTQTGLQVINYLRKAGVVA